MLVGEPCITYQKFKGFKACRSALTSWNFTLQMAKLIFVKLVTALLGNWQKVFQIALAIYCQFLNMAMM